jgi:L-ascorbate metabolism protein UlaG (beta-lactamase superfamily)
MSEDVWYLHSNVQAEPLIDRWYAWAHLIPPVTAARNMTERHFKIMDSYIAAPQVHASAVANPKMLGGPFINYGGIRIDEIKTLKEETSRRRALLINLSESIAELSKMLSQNAKGESLQPLYSKVPECLRGYLELTYDLNNNPNFRFFEAMIYKGALYDPSGQSLMLSMARGDDRPFALSTPRLNDAEATHIEVPFNDPLIDELFKLKRCGSTLKSIQDLLAPYADRIDRVQGLLTQNAPKPYTPYAGDGVRWRYFGHACILIEVKGISVLFDPIISYEYDASIPRYTYSDLPDRIDCVVITHNHQDHILFETLLQIRHKVDTFVVPRSSGGTLQDPSLKLILETVGCKNVVEVDTMQTIDLGDLLITALPFLGEHADLDIKCKAAFLVEAHGRRLLFAADSCNVEPYLYRNLAPLIGDIDALFLGMECEGAPLSWLYGPLFVQKIERVSDQSRRLSGSNFNQAMGILENLSCDEVYIYAMGQEPWLTYISSIRYTAESKPIIESNKLLDECRRQGKTAERLYGEREILLDSKRRREFATAAV